MFGGQPESLWGNRNFRLLITAQTLSAVGDSFSYVAIPLLVLHTTGSIVQMGAVTAAAGIASVGAGTFAGYVADRVDKRRLLISCDLARCLLYGTIPIVWMFSAEVWLLYLLLPLAGAFSQLSDVTNVVLVPSIVGEAQITEANGRLYGAYSIAEVSGPMLAGVVSAGFGPAAAVAIDAVSFAVCAAIMRLVRLPHTQRDEQRARQNEPTAGAKPGGRAIIADLVAGARFLWRHPVLRTLTILLSLLIFATFGVTDLIVFHLKHDLHSSDSTVGYVLAATTIGAFLAAALVARARRRLGFGACWVGAWGLCGAAIAFLGLAPSALLVGALAALQLLCIGVAGICSMSLRQEITPAPLLGRVTSAFWTIHKSLGPLGAAVLTAAASRFGVAAVCLAAGSACLLIALSAMATPIWQPHPERSAGVK